MKKIMMLLIVILVGWNLFLTKEVYELKKTPAPIAHQNTAHPDMSDLVFESEESVVTISALKDDQLLSSGSGAIYKAVDQDAYIITNAHVVEDGNRVLVSFANDKTFEARLLGLDELTDIAVLKVSCDFDIVPFRIGDSSSLQKGEYVLAMGSPLGIEYQGSVCGGLISGLNRHISMDTDHDGTLDWDVNVIQTDAPINPGNSGGPLISMKGELIGINALKLSAEDIEGFGFAFPINETLEIVAQLEENGRVIRPVIGVRVMALSELSTFDRFIYGIDSNEEGLYVISLMEDGPMENTGIQVGDRLLTFDGEKVDDLRTLNKYLYTKQVGDEVMIHFIHKGEEMAKTIILK